ncbi:COG4223 family protein [Bradyrhizobium sp. USDA 4452]
MAEERPDDPGPSPDSRPKRPPPTIDLQATEISSEPQRTEGSAEAGKDTEKDSDKDTDKAAEASAPEAEPHPDPAPHPEPHPEAASAASGAEPSRPVSPWVVAPISGAVAAALVIGVGWLLGWPAVQPVSAPPPGAVTLDELGTRLAALESKPSKPLAAAADPAATARLEALDKSIAALRTEIAATRAQSDKLVAAVNEATAAPRDGAAAPDISGITARIDKVEGAVKAQGAAIARQDSKIADSKAEAKADDVPLRRVVAAALLDVAVRHGDPYASALEAAKAITDNPDLLKPLDVFAASGVPTPNHLCRELIEIVPQLAPPPPEAAAASAGLVDRLQAGASKLIRIERTDGTGTDRGSIVARVTSAAVHNDLALTERELKSLPPADRTAAQAWLAKVDARRAALDASRKFADNAMAALATVNQ